MLEYEVALTFDSGETTAVVIQVPRELVEGSWLEIDGGRFRVTSVSRRPSEGERGAVVAVPERDYIEPR